MLYCDLTRYVIDDECEVGLKSSSYDESNSLYRRYPEISTFGFCLLLLEGRLWSAVYNRIHKVIYLFAHRF